MHDSFDPLRVLYGEARPDGTAPTRDDLSAAERAELAALAPVQAALDARPSQRPDASVLAAVLDAARTNGAAAPATARAADRAPVRAARRSRSRVALPILALFACGALGLSLFLTQRPPASAPLAETASPLADAAPEPAAEPEPAELAAESDAVREDAAVAPVAAAAAAPEAERSPARAPAARTAASRTATPEAAFADAAPTADPVPQSVRVQTQPPPLARAAVQPQAGLTLAGDASVWDTPDDDLRLLSLRLQTLREANAGLAWDEPPVALSADRAEGLPRRALDLTSDTIHDEPRVGFHSVPQRAGWIRVQAGGR